MITSTDPRSIYHWIASGLGSGWLPKAPGTWGSLVALPPAWWIVDTTGYVGLLIASFLVSLLGCWVCARIIPTLAKKDPGWIVIDEWAGQWLCIALLIPFMDHQWLVFLIAFVAFRVFDIFKPWPVSLAETAGPAWWSIMADDLVAGVMGAGLVLLLAMLAVMVGF